MRLHGALTHCRCQEACPSDGKFSVESSVRYGLIILSVLSGQRSELRTKGTADDADQHSRAKLSRLHRSAGLASLLVATACGGQQAASTSSAKAGGPKIELAGATPTPCPAARCQVAVLVKNDQGQPIENSDVRYDARHTSMGHGGVSATADNRGGGRYAGAVNFSMAGDWSVSVQVRLPGNNNVYAETVKLGVQ